MKRLFLSKILSAITCVSLVGMAGARASDEPTPEENFDKAVALLEESPSDTTAIVLLVAAATGGHAGAANRLGFQYDNGLGVRKDAEKARTWFEAAAGLGLPKAKYNLARLLLRQDAQPGEKDRGMALMEEAAREGIMQADSMLGDIYRAGAYGRAKDHPKALEHYSRAAAAGDADAQHACGVLLSAGWGVKRSPAESAEWFRRAALQGHRTAQGAYGEALLLGQGVKADRLEGLKFLILSEQQGDVHGTRILTERRREFTEEEMAGARKAASEFKPVSEAGTRQQT